MPRDHQLFVGWNDVQLNSASSLRDQAPPRRIGRWIKPCTKPVELLRDPSTHHAGVFANTCRKDKCVKPSERAGQRTCAQSDMVHKVVDREGCAWILAVGEIPYVVADARKSLETALPIEEILDLRVSHVLL